MKNLILFCALATVLLFTGCEERDQSYSGADVVEFKNHYLSISSPTTIIPNVVTTGATLTNRTVRDAIGNDSILVQLVGRQRASAITVNYTLAPEPSGAILAADPVTHYNISGTSGTVIIPPNSSSAWIRLSVVNFGIAGDPSRRFSLRLTGGDVGTSANYNTFFYTIQPN
jgi:hypothetical protein